MSTTRKPTKAFLIRLRSKGLCFVCLRKTESLNQVNEFQTGALNPNPRTFRLRAVTRFLGVNTKRILETFLTPELSKCDDVKVELCRKCTELVKQVNELYQTLELTRLKLDDCMGKICNLIGEADKDHDRVEEMRERVTHAATAGVVRGLRKKMFEKFSEKLEVETPRVVLERLSTKQLDAYRPRAKFKETVEEDDEQSEFDNGDPNGPVSEPEHSVTLRAVRGGHSSSLFVRRGYLWKPFRREDAKKKFKCHHCGSQMNLGKSGWNMKMHLVRCHCTQLLMEHKLPQTPEDLFESIVRQLLSKDLAVREGDSSRCLICSRTFTNLKVVQFCAGIVHLIEDHEDTLQSRLMELQVEPDLRRKLESPPNPAVRMWKYKRISDNNNKKNSRASRTGTMSGGPRSIAKVKPEEPESEMIVSSADLVEFGATNSWRKQKGRPSKDSIFKRKGYFNKVISRADYRKLHTCPHCGSQRSLGNSGWNMRSHMVRRHCHHLLMEHKFPSISEDTFEAIVARLLFKDLLVREGERSRCPICSKTFANFRCAQFSSLKLHLMEEHPNLLSSKLTEIQEIQI